MFKCPSLLLSNNIVRIINFENPLVNDDQWVFFWNLSFSAVAISQITVEKNKEKYIM